MPESYAGEKQKPVVASLSTTDLSTKMADEDDPPSSPEVIEEDDDDEVELTNVADHGRADTATRKSDGPIKDLAFWVEHPLWVLSLMVVVFAVAFTSLNTLPAALYSGPTDAFIAGRALKPLERLVHCGTKMIGTVANEHCAVRVVTDELGNIKREAGAAAERLETDIQRTSGSFHIDFIGGFHQSYDDLTNVVARVKGEGERNGKHSILNALGTQNPVCEPPYAILVSAHFDSAIGSAAASDDGTPISMMLEMVRRSFTISTMLC